MRPLVLAVALLAFAAPLAPSVAATGVQGCTAYVLENWWILYVNCGTVPAYCVDLIVAYVCTRAISTEVGIGCGPEVEVAACPLE